MYDDEVADSAQRERSFSSGDISLHCQVTGLGEVEPICDLYASPELPIASFSIAAEVVISTQRRLTELLRGHYVRTSPAVEALRARLVPETVDTVCAAAAAAIGALSVRDAAGAAMSGDWLTAAAAAEIALEYALDAALFAAGDPYRSRKFLPRRLSRTPELATLLDDLRRPGQLPADTPEALERRTRETLLAANGIQAAALLDTGPVWSRVPQGAGPLRSPYVSLVTTDAGLRLTGATECVLGRPAAVLWLLADGRPLPDLVARFAELHGLPRDDVERFVETNVAGLVAEQAVEPEPQA